MRRLLLVLVVVAAAGAAGAWVWAVSVPEIAAAAPPDPAALDGALVERGEMLAAVGDCAVCHTAADGQPYAGGLALPTPFGTILSTNITPDPETGIGRWSEAAFVRAMRRGIDREGNHLFPAFPYDDFTRVTDADLSALYAYLMAQPAVAAPAQPNDLRFPFGYRPLLAGWKLLFLREGPLPPDPALDEEQARGRYLVEGLGHCGACHSPRNPFGAVRRGAPLAGGEAENWHVPPLGARSRSPAGWSRDAYVNYLFDGWDEAHGIAAGPMTAVADHLYDADEDDVFAMAAYLATLAPEPDAAATAAAVAAAGALDWAEGAATGTPAADDPALKAGEAVFAAACARCHKARVAETQPASLALTAAVNAPDARNFLHVVRDGIAPPYGARQRAMPAQERNLGDADLASLAAYARWYFTDLPPWPDVPGTLATLTAEN